uniref:Uncharacterized protein n=1 Tax=Rhizophora mucronata TaxID=61149 RepID=A0A2P2N1U0_RHIMU
MCKQAKQIQIQIILSFSELRDVGDVENLGEGEKRRVRSGVHDNGGEG